MRAEKAAASADSTPATSATTTVANALLVCSSIARALPNTAATEATVATMDTEISTPAWDRRRTGQVASQASTAPPTPQSSAVR